MIEDYQLYVGEIKTTWNGGESGSEDYFIVAAKDLDEARGKVEKNKGKVTGRYHLIADDAKSFIDAITPVFVTGFKIKVEPLEQKVSSQ